MKMINCKLCLLEMGRSSVDAEVRPKNSAECSARFGSATWDYSAEVRQTFGVIGASNWRHFELAAGVNQSQYTYY